MKTNVREEIITLIGEAVSRITGAPCDTSQLYLDLPTDERFGDLATNAALRLCRTLKKKPLEVAKLIASDCATLLAASPLKAYVREVKAEGAGFVNFYLRDEFFYEQLSAIIDRGEEFARRDIGKGKAVLLEFVSANPTGPLSVAHARQAVVGDALANILSYLGYRVQREFYLNDEGNQINILGASLRLRLQELQGQQVDFPEDHYQGEYLIDLAREILAKGFLLDDPSEYAASHILSVIRQELADFGVAFDCWYSQKGLRVKGLIDRAFSQLKGRDCLFEEEGATWFRSTRFGDDKDRVVIKSDGSYTYLAPDIAYHQDKYERGFQWLINLWGPDHHGYIKRLKAAVEALGHDPETLSIVIVQLATIFRGGKPVQMSTRRGQYITLREVLDEVGRDAARFFFAMRRTSSHLDFDLEVAKKQTPENPVYYVQYAHARISSILRAQQEAPHGKQASVGLLKEPEEMALIKKLCQLPTKLEVCLITCDPYMLTVYLQEVAEAFHKFYDRHRVLGQETTLTSARLALCLATRTVLACGLKLLGVSCPDKM